MRTVVFDFDKTLTRDDTLTVFLRSDLHLVSRWIYYGLKLLSKLKLISIRLEKEIALGFLCHGDAADIRLRLNNFSKRIELNPIANICQEEIKKGARVIILSASPEEYLKPLFHDAEVLGAVLKNQTGKFLKFKLSRHPHGKEKLDILINYGIQHVDTMYYDSDSDEALIPLCDEWYRIKNGKVFLHGYRHKK